MPANARMTDLFLCKCKKHPKKPRIGLIILGSSDQKVENLAQARMTDFVITTKKCLGFILNGSSSAKTNSLAKARVGDVVIGLKYPIFKLGIIIIGAGSEETG